MFLRNQQNIERRANHHPESSWFCIRIELLDTEWLCVTGDLGPQQQYLRIRLPHDFTVRAPRTFTMHYFAIWAYFRPENARVCFPKALLQGSPTPKINRNQHVFDKIKINPFGSLFDPPTRPCPLETQARDNLKRGQRGGQNLDPGVRLGHSELLNPP